MEQGALLYGADAAALGEGLVRQGKGYLGEWVLQEVAEDGLAKAIGACEQLTPVQPVEAMWGLGTKAAA